MSEKPIQKFGLNISIQMRKELCAIEVYPAWVGHQKRTNIVWMENK